MAFDVTTLLGEQVSKLDTKEVVQIPIGNIRTNPKNFYTVERDEELIDSIQTHGILEPLLVVADGDGYRLISGHRRLQAVRNLRVEYWDAPKMVPCLVLDGGMADYEETQILIESNRQRKKTAYEEGQEALKLLECYKQAAANGAKLSGRKRALVAEALKMNESRIAEAGVIEKNLRVAGFKEDYRLERMPHSVAYLIAKDIDHEGQYRLLDYQIASHEPWSMKLVKRFLKEREKPADTEEPVGASPVPTDGVAVDGAVVKESLTTVWHRMEEDSDVGENVLVRYVNSLDKECFFSAMIVIDCVGDGIWVNESGREFDPDIYGGWMYVPPFDLEVE